MEAPRIILICQDLIFTTKVKGTAQGLGFALQVVTNANEAARQAGANTRLVIVDLSSPRSTTGADLQQLRQHLATDCRLLAYGSHVDVDRLREARAAGCEPVLPRSELTTQLTEILRSANNPA